MAVALRCLLRTTTLAGVEFPDYLGLGYVSLKWRRLLGEELAGLRMWVRTHGAHELCQLADDRQDHRTETLQLNAMERYALRHADGWVGPSAATLDWLRRTYAMDRPTWHRTPAFERIGPACAHPRRLDRTGPIRILYYGKLQRLKGADLFVQAAVALAARRAERIEFDLVGAEVAHSYCFRSFRAELEAAIPAPLRDRFRFHGPIDPARLPGLAMECALAVVPSRMETFCLAAHELNWIGIPLVVSELPAFRDHFRDGENCRTFDGTASGLTDVLDQILEAPCPFATWRWQDTTADTDPEPLYREVLATCRPSAAPSPPRDGEAPLVSMIVPYHEMHDFVDATLASVEVSSYRNWEVILVDDGSQSAAALAKLAELRVRYAGDPRVQILSKPNGGLGSARNHAIAHAAGRYVLPLDSDDLVCPDYLRLAVCALEAAPELDAVSCYVSYFDNGHLPEEICDYVIPYDLLVPSVFLENRAGVACSVFRRTVFERHRYNEQLFSYEDWELWWQLAGGGGAVETLPRILFRYRRRPGSMVNTVGYSRHARLVGMMAARHSETLAREWPSIFRTYVEELYRLRETLAKRRDEATNPRAEVAADEQVPGYEYSVRLAAALALRLLRARVRAAVDAARGRRMVTVRVAGDHHPDAQGREVWCAGVRAVRDDVWGLNGLIGQAGPWDLRNGGAPPRAKLLVGTTPGAELHFGLGAQGFGIGFLHHPWSGRAILSVDGRTETVDLFAAGARQGFYDHFWTGSRWVSRQVR